MERLNLRTPKTSNYDNESGKTQAKIRYYCVSEGQTEESYFTGIRNNKIELGIRSDVHINIIEVDELGTSVGKLIEAMRE